MEIEPHPIYQGLGLASVYFNGKKEKRQQEEKKSLGYTCLTMLHFFYFLHTFSNALIVTFNCFEMLLIKIL